MRRCAVFDWRYGNAVSAACSLDQQDFVPHALPASRDSWYPTAPIPQNGYAAAASDGSSPPAPAAPATAWPNHLLPPSPGLPRCRVSLLSIPPPPLARILGTPAATRSPPP